MHTRTHNWFLVLIALALAVAPMRAAWTISMSADTENPSHCAQMDMQTAMQQQDSATASGHNCEPGCSGSCCDAACSACAHGATILADCVISTPVLHDTPRHEWFLAAFPERTVIPPLRPPASL